MSLTKAYFLIASKWVPHVSCIGYVTKKDKLSNFGSPDSIFALWLGKSNGQICPCILVFSFFPQTTNQNLLRYI
ncbi:unnamed protein product [Lactuca virosa]|uniref:Uncharacterized protein n=1 Tax=Lactuca virosa TaxID=75947 RepID=A0AAU9MFR8_9ASTR|nr:unnamed protein product [Lactuca virosa]